MGSELVEQQVAAVAAESARDDHPAYYGRGWRGGGGGGSFAKPHSMGSAAGSDSDSDAGGQGDDSDEACSSTGENRDAHSSSSSTVPQRQKQPEQPPAPLRARCAPVTVQFTATESEHLPARESREEEIRQIKKRSGAAAQLPVDDSVDIADRQPAFLKDKGDGLYAQGNYRWEEGGGACSMHSCQRFVGPGRGGLALAECMQPECPRALILHRTGPCLSPLLLPTTTVASHPCPSAAAPLTPTRALCC